MTLAAILRNATFTSRPEARSGEELYWHALVGQYIALPSVSASADEQLRKNGYKAVKPDHAESTQFDALTALRRMWPDLHKPHPDLIAHRLTGESCRTLISIQPTDERGRMGRWLMARCKALGKNDVATAVGEYMATTDVRAAHPWATGRGQSNQFLLSQSLGSAFILTGSESSGYTLHTFATGDSASRLRDGETISDILTPSADWSNSDWEHYDALLTAKPLSEAAFWDHPALIKFLGVRNKVVSDTDSSWAERIRSNGAGALLGGQHAALQKRFLNDISAAWLDHMADDLGLRLNNQSAYRLLTDCWMALRTSDAECISHVIPAIREAHPEAFAGYTDNQLLSLWRSSFQPITDHIRQSSSKKKAELIRTSQAYADMSPATMRDVLSAHYGAPAIDALVSAGKLHLLANHDGLPMDIRLRSSSSLSNIAGATTPDNTVYLIGNRITPQALPGLFLHEVGEHAALATMLGPDYGRMSKHFQKLLRDKDTYATWAAMRVPSSTRPEHVASEQLAYLVERVANDENARQGGQEGHALGQECLANLRTWLFRTPLCRWLDDIGALDDFTLRPQDMASLAREAVDFFVDQVKPGTVIKNRNTWIDALNPATLDMLYRSAPQARIQALEKLDSEQALGYLYALAMTRAPLISTAIDHFSATLATLASGAGKPELQAVAGELLALQQSMDTQDQLKAQIERAGFAMWIDGTSDPDDARLHFLTPSPKTPGLWQLNHYRKGAGAYSDDQYDNAQVALDQVQTASFMVSDAEAATVLQDWAALAGQDQQTRSQSFNRWFGASQAADSTGNALVLYHGTGQDLTEFKGFTIWASTSPALANEYADYRGTWEDGGANVMPVFMQAERPFDADRLETTVTLKSFFEEAATQANAAGRTFDAEQAVVLLNHIKGCSRREESGPYYRAHDIWNQVHSIFGSDGAESVKSLIKLLGFDSIKMTEHQQITYGVFEPTQVKSAIGNRGSFDAKNADIRFKGSNPVDAPAFKDWFRESKILNGNGEPMVVYHGTNAVFTDFKGDELFFADSEFAARQYGKNVIPVYLNITNPKIVDYYGNEDNEIEADIEDAREEGHDGLIVLRAFDGRLVFDQYVAFDAAQIKSVLSTDADMQPPAVEADSMDAVAALKRWAGKTKVAGEDGLPKVVFHGTGADIVRFDPAMIGQGADHQQARTNAFWFSSSEMVSEMFASLAETPAIMPVFLKLENPLVVDCEEWARKFGTLYEGFKFGEGRIAYNIMWFKQAAVAQARADGFDGVIFTNGYDGRPVEGAINYAVFEPAQIKSAIGNRGTYEQYNSDIRLKTSEPSESPAVSGQFEQIEVANINQALQAGQSASELSEQLQAEYPGMKLDLLGKGERITLSRIVLPKEGRGQGVGTQVMQQIIRWADQNGKFVTLTPSADFGGTKNRLTGFYKRFGFVENKGKNRDFEVSEAMYRPAQQQPQQKVEDQSRNSNIGAMASAAMGRFNLARDKVSRLLVDGGYKNLYEWMSPQAVMDDYATAVTQMQFGQGTGGSFKEQFNELDAAYDLLLRHAPYSIDVFPENGPIPAEEEQEAVPDLAAVIPLTQPPETLKQAVEVRTAGDGRWYLVDGRGEWGTFAHPSKAKAEAALAHLGATSDSADYSLADYSAISAEDAERLMANAGDNLLNVMLAIKKARPDLKPAVDDAFTSIAYFYEDVPGLLGLMAKAAIKRHEGAAVKQSIMVRTGGDLAGLQLASKDGKQFAFFLPDASDPGRFRASLFDERGFFGHSTRDSYAELLDEAFTDGYRTEVAGKLESMAGTQTFADGNDLVAKVQAVNAGRMSWKELVDGQKAKEAALANSGATSDSTNVHLSLKQTDAPAFKRWFGNSKIVGPDGSPTTMYHGTTRNIQEPVMEPNHLGLIFVTQDVRFAHDYASVKTTLDGDVVGSPHIMPMFVRAENPWDFASPDHIEALVNNLREKGLVDGDKIISAENKSTVGRIEDLEAGDWATIEFPQVVEAIKALGFDGLYLRELDTKNLAVFDSKQIKSAIGNSGDFDRDNADIRFKLSEPTTETAPFKNWFKKSKVTDLAGNPLVVYHGTKADIAEFDPELAAASASAQATGVPGFYFAKSAGVANGFARKTVAGGNNVIPAYLSIQNPATVQYAELIGGTFDRQKFEDEGFDGVQVLRGDDTWAFIAFHPTQVKSAIGNIGSFDPENADIRFSFAGQNAQTADRNLLEQAQSRHSAGDDAEVIRRETGWFQSHDQGWRFEIDDSRAAIPDNWYQDGEANGEPVMRMDGYLGDHLVDIHPVAAERLGRSTMKVTGILNHPLLFAAYPELSTINVVLERSEGYTFAENGVFRRDTVNGEPYDSILIRYNPARGGNGLSALLHEAQHAIQKVEGFARGGSTREFNAEQLINEELSSINQRTSQVLQDNPETATVYRAYTRLRIQANDAGWPELMMGNVAALEAELCELPGGSDLFDLETERFGIQFIDKVAMPFEKYRHLAGEVEARNVQTRLDFNALQRTDTPPFSTEDVAPGEVDVRPNSPSVIVMALQQEQAERESARSGVLDMSRDARLARAQVMGFDPSKTWYHGSDAAGFKVFDTAGKGKTKATGAFLANRYDMAGSYSKRNVDAPIFTGEGLFNDPDQLDDLEIERLWVAEDSRGIVEFQASQRDYDTAEQFLEGEGIELDPSDVVRAAYTIHHEGYLLVENATEQEAIDELNNIEAKEPGIYSLYVRSTDQLVIDWEGKNWDQGPEVPVWKICDEDDALEYCYSKETADEALARHPGCHIEEDSEAPYLTTDDAAGQAREMGYDSVLIKNVYDSGSHSDGSIEGDVLVVFDPANIRSTDAVFDPAHTASGNLLFSITEAPQSPVFDQWFDGSQVCNDDGTPLVVYRGEHARSSDAVFQSRLGSLSFGDYETASLYATQPNNLSDSPISPRIIPAYLAIKRPLVVNDDPFVDFSLLIETLGFERASVIATDLAGYIRNTQAWADLNSSLPVGDYIAKHPEALASLYVELYPILDDPKYVDWLKAAGFDGAIYGGSGASFNKTEYRVFDPAQVASGAPMPVTPNAPSSSTRMALTQPASSTQRFIGSPVSGEQFTLEYDGIGIPGQYGYGLYLPDAKAVGERAGNNGAFNQYAGAALTPATIRKLRTDEATPVALRRLFASFAKELADGDDAQALLQAHIRTLQNSLAAIELDQSDLVRGESVLLSAAYYAELERQVKADLGTLINHMPKFEHVRPSSSLPSPADYLSWDAPLADQSDEIRDALAMTGIDGYWEVQSAQGVAGFMSKIEADAHYTRLSNEGGRPSLVDQFAPGHPGVPSGGDIYRELSELLGSAQVASTRLREAGVKGVRYLPAPSPTGDASESYVIFSAPKPAKAPATLPDLTEQMGIDQPAYPMAFSQLPAVVLNGRIDAIAHELREARALMATTLELKIDDFADRHHWLSNLPNADGKLFQMNKAALFEARSELQRLNHWRSPTVGNCLPWSSPLSDEACNQLAPLIRVSPAEQITGEVVFHLLAERIGSNKAATDALMKTGFVGAYTEQGVAMWDAASRCLSQKISASHDRNRYHLVAHGSKHLIDSFSSEKIGTGEGVQAFGYGLYFADRKMVAAHYQKMRVREGCWYERTLYDTPSEMVHEVEQRLARTAVSEDMLQAAKHCLSIATWAPQRVDDVLQQYPSEHHQPIREILNGYSKVSNDQLTSFFLMPQKGVRDLNEIMEHDDRDYSMGLSYLGSGLHFYVREDMDDLKISQTLTDHIRRQCDVEQAIEARNQVLLDLERKPHDDYFQSRLRDCDYFLNMAKCAQKTLDAYGPFSLERPLGSGNLYLVDLAISPSEYLRYDLPYSKQSTCVQQALFAITTEPALSELKQKALITAIADDQMGHDLLGSIAGRGNYYNAECSENEKLASSLLLERGVQGIKYPDGLSRENGGGSFNYVVFDDERIQILGHSDKHLRNEADEIPLYEWADTEVLDTAKRMGM